MPTTLLREFLDDHEIKYVSIKHSLAYSAQEIAESAHIPGKDLAKIVIIKIDGTPTMAVLPASKSVNFTLLKKLAKATDVVLATEADFQGIFPGCEVGAMPPFGNLYGLVVYVDKNLTEGQEIAFNAWSHTELIRLRYQDYARLAKPIVGSFAIP